MLCLGLTLAIITAIADAACTKTHTTYTTIEAKTETFSSTLSTTTVYIYSSTVTVGTPYGGPHPISTPTGNIYTCHYYTEPHIPPFAGSSSHVPSPSVAAREADPEPEAATCITVQKTVTVKHRCTEIDIIYPGPDFVTKQGVLTTRIPNFCTGGGHKASRSLGPNSVTLLGYPYFPQNPVDCCVYCAQQVTANLVAAAQVIDCQCLINTAGSYPGKNRICPKGTETYTFGKKSGAAFPGPCQTS